MTEQYPPDAPQEPAGPAQSLGDTIRALRVLRGELRAAHAEQSRRMRPNASRGARIAGVPLSTLPPHLRSVDAVRDGDGDE